MAHFRHKMSLYMMLRYAWDSQQTTNEGTIKNVVLAARVFCCCNFLMRMASCCDCIDSTGCCFVWGRWIGALSDCTKPCWVFNASWFCYGNFPSLCFESSRVFSLSISPASFWRMRPHDSWLRRRTFCSSGGKEAIITGVTKFIIELKTEYAEERLK